MKKRTAQDYVLLLSKGLAMGAADVVPGVSGGTIAFITGIYSELLHSIKSLTPATLIILYKEGWSAFWRHINGNFLLAVFAGILISVKTFASVITYCLESYPLLVWGFFSGLILASVIMLVREHEGWAWRDALLCLVGCAFVVWISVVKSAQLPGEWWILFLGGFVAICAMILPGISGSFILLLLGLYSVFLEAVNTLDILAILSFGAGCVCGLLVFSRFLSWLLDRYMRQTIAILIGFLIGSLNVTWPWKHTLETVLDRHGEVVPVLQTNVLPWNYENEAKLMVVILCAFIGFTLVLSTEFFAKKLVQLSSD